MQVYKKHRWPEEPIVTLRKEWKYRNDTEWSSIDTANYQGSINNELVLKVKMCYKGPYGGLARFNIRIFKFTEYQIIPWELIINDEVIYVRQNHEPKDEWIPKEKEYSLYQYVFSEDQKLEFMINVRIWQGGAMSTPKGSPGSWGDFYGKRFVANFDSGLQRAEALIAVKELHLEEIEIDKKLLPKK